MRGGWWRFWTGSAWRGWSAERKAWESYRRSYNDVSSRIAAAASELGHAKQSLGQVRQALAWVRPLGTTPVPLDLKRHEIGLAVVPQVTLLELRRREGREVWTPISTGTMNFTDRRAVFQGSKKVVFDYKDLTDASLWAEGLHLAVGQRKASHLLAGPATQLDTVLSASLSIADGVDPLIELQKAEAEGMVRVAGLESQVAELNQARQALHRPARPFSPGWAAGLVFAVVFLLASGGVAQQSLVPAPSPSSTSTTSERETSSPMAVSSSTAPAVAGRETAVVASITDGDTIRVNLSDGRSEPVRLIGIDAPDSGDDLYIEARTYLATLVEGAEVELVSDVSDRDRFGRLLRYVYVGGLFVNRAMVESGHAVAVEYPPDTAEAEVLAAAEQVAKNAGVGMWGSATTVAPSTTASTTTTSTTTTTTATTTTTVEDECHPSYEGACLAIGQGDYDCEGGSGNGPNYIRGPVYVVGPDDFDLDRDGDGVGCEG